MLEDSYGGFLELWDRDMQSCVTRLLPVFNRMVIFNTDDYSYHGHPDPLSCPKNRTRKSLALYYYANDRPGAEVQFAHSTNTNYQSRPGEEFDKKIKKTVSMKIKRKLSKLFK